MRRRQSGFTLIELLVVIGLISVLISILLPTVIRAREQAQRVRCASNVKQLVAAAIAYASDNGGELPSGQRDVDTDEHPIWISHATYQTFTKYAGTRPQYTVPQPEGTIGDPILTCPNLIEPLELPVKGNLGWVIGYNYLGGHPKLMAVRGWTSAFRATANGNLPIIADLNDWAPTYWTIVPHQYRGGGGFFNDQVGAHPSQRQAAGGNTGYLDGSVRWRALSEMQPHSMYNWGAGTEWMSMW